MLRMPHEDDCLKFLEGCKRLYAMEFLCYGQGNLSWRIDDNVLLTTPTGADYENLRTDDLIAIDLQRTFADKVVCRCDCNGMRKPTSEVWMHLLAAERFYPQMCWFGHTHKSPIPQFSGLKRPIPSDMYPATRIISDEGAIPCVPPYKWGSRDLAEGVRVACTNSRGCYMARHGGFAMGSDFLECMRNLQTLRDMAEYYLTFGNKYPRMSLEERANASVAMAAYRTKK